MDKQSFQPPPFPCFRGGPGPGGGPGKWGGGNMPPHVRRWIRRCRMQQRDQGWDQGWETGDREDDARKVAPPSDGDVGKSRKDELCNKNPSEDPSGKLICFKNLFYF